MGCYVRLIKSALRKILAATFITQDDISPGGKWYKAFLDLKEICKEAHIKYHLKLGTFEEEGPMFELEDASWLLAGDSNEYVDDLFLHQVSIKQREPNTTGEYVSSKEKMVDFLKKRYGKRERKFKGKF